MSMTPIVIPEDGQGCQVVASVSGGKDSTALILALREAEISTRFVFADTHWEAPETYEYLDLLRERLGIAIDVVGYPGGMVAKIQENARFPGRMQRWCTRELKIQPLRTYHDQIEEREGVETICAVGVRADESAARGALGEWEDDPQWGGYVWRPLIAWSVAEVLAIHRRHDIPVNPLYQRGHDRVGCYPCIFSNKEEIRLMAEQTPERIDLIRSLEASASAMREDRNTERPGRYKDTDATFFQTQRKGFSGIDAVVAWARTDTGGRQFPLFSPPPRGGCMRWGLCDTGTGKQDK